MKAGTEITERMRKDVLEAWSESEEITANFDQLTDEELIECLPSIRERAKRIQSLLGTYVSGEDLDEICPL
jgi:uncharacterized protein (DUF433 family)